MSTSSGLRPEPVVPRLDLTPAKLKQQEILNIQVENIPYKQVKDGRRRREDDEDEGDGGSEQGG